MDFSRNDASWMLETKGEPNGLNPGESTTEIESGFWGTFLFRGRCFGSDQEGVSYYD